MKLKAFFFFSIQVLGKWQRQRTENSWVMHNLRNQHFKFWKACDKKRGEILSFLLYALSIQSTRKGKIVSTSYLFHFIHSGTNYRFLIWNSLTECSQWDTSLFPSLQESKPWSLVEYIVFFASSCNSIFVKHRIYPFYNLLLKIRVFLKKQKLKCHSVMQSL